MFHLKNDTPFVSQMFVFPNIQGIDTLYVVVKATFDLGPSIHIAEKQQPIIMEDTYWAEPGKSSLKYPAEVHQGKPGTDVIVVGEACAPEERPVPEMQVGLSVAGRVCHLKIFGDRYWKKGFLNVEPGTPRPFLRMPIVYERAYGGMHTIDESSGNILMEERNPIGKGFVGNRREREIDGMALPNIEDPKNLIKSPKDRPKPRGFGAIAPYWQPRVSWAGTYDTKWQNNIAPYLPEDFDPRYFHSAHPDLIFTDYLKSGEAVVILNMSPKGRQTFKLPVCEPRVDANIIGRFDTVKANLETVLMEPTDERISLTWRASATSGKKITGAEVEVTS